MSRADAPRSFPAALVAGGSVAVAAQATLLAAAVRAQGPRGWTVGLAMIAVNGALCALPALAVRIRLLPWLALLTTASLTEALLWPVAATGRNNRGISTVAMIGLAALAAAYLGLVALRRRRNTG